MATKQDDKALSKVKADQLMTTPGTFMPDEFADMIQGEGFEEVDTILLGNPEEGKVPMYVGQILERGESVEASIGDTRGTMPTFNFHPLRKTPAGTILVDRTKTHIVIAPYDLNAHFSRILATCERRKATAIVGVAYDKRVKTSSGRPLNKFRVFPRYALVNDNGEVQTKREAAASETKQLPAVAPQEQSK